MSHFAEHYWSFRLTFIVCDDSMAKSMRLKTQGLQLTREDLTRVTESKGIFELTTTRGKTLG